MEENEASTRAVPDASDELASWPTLRQAARMKQRAFALARLDTIAAVAAILLTHSVPSVGKDRTITGTIARYECGDNCYLTIVDRRKAEHVGLCTAPECAQWNENAAMPARYKGKRVTVSVGQGEQLNGEGEIMDEMAAFTKIRFLD